MEARFVLTLEEGHRVIRIGRIVPACLRSTGLLKGICSNFFAGNYLPMSKVRCDDEKTRISLDEVQGESGSNAADREEDVLPAAGTRERAIAEKKLLRKLDTRLLPTIFVIYIMNYTDVRGLLTQFLVF